MLIPITILVCPINYSVAVKGTPKLQIDVISVFPDYLLPLNLSLIGKAQEKGLLDLRVHDLRDWASDRHRTVDDTPYGGGAGMVMRPDVWGLALDSIIAPLAPIAPALAFAEPPEPPHEIPPQESAVPLTIIGEPEIADSPSNRTQLIIPTPAGDVFTQRAAEQLASAQHLVFACGRYEGIDARVANYYRTQPNVIVHEYSIGDYVLNGGEVAALAMIEAITRLIPGVIGNPESLIEESHSSAGLLEYPVFTKPPEWRGLPVPEILLSGNHQKVAYWRHEQALDLTKTRRPDLLENN